MDPPFIYRQITEAVGQVSVPLELKQLNIEDNLEVIMQLQG